MDAPLCSPVFSVVKFVTTGGTEGTENIVGPGNQCEDGIVGASRELSIIKSE